MNDLLDLEESNVVRLPLLRATDPDNRGDAMLALVLTYLAGLVAGGLLVVAAQAVAAGLR